MTAFDESGSKAVVGKTSGYWLCDDDFFSTLELKALKLGRIGFPRDWPAVYSSNKTLKQLIGKKGTCAGKKVGVMGSASEEELALVKGVTCLPLQSFANSEKVRDAAGLEIVKGWAVYEHLDHGVGEGFVAERYWWNARTDGTWVDFTPRPEAWSELLLAEAVGDASKARSVLTTSDAELVQALLSARGLLAPSSTEDDDDDMPPLMESSPTAPSSSSDPVKPGKAPKPLVERGCKGDEQAVKELAEQAKADDELALQIAAESSLLKAAAAMLKEAPKKEASVRLLLAITDAAVAKKHLAVKDAVVAAKAVPGLAALLKDSNAELQEFAAAVFGNLSHESPENQEAIMSEAKVVDSLVEMLDASIRPAQEAAYAVWNLTVGHEANSKAFVSAGAVPKLVKLLSSQSDVAQENAAGALMHVTVAEVARNEMVKAGAIARLCELLAPSYEPEVNCQAAGALLNLASDCPDCAVKIVQSGAVGPLITLVKEGLDLTKEYAAGALMNLIRNDAQVAEQAAKLDAVTALAGLLNKGLGPSEALGALANLASGSPERQTAIFKAQVTRKSVAYLRDKSLEVRRGAAALIMNLSPHTKIKERIVEAKALKPLAECLKDEDEAVRERAAGALANLFNDHSKNVHLGFEQAPEMIPRLVAMLSTGEKIEDSQRQAAHALAMLAAEDGSCDAVWEAKAGPALLTLLKAHMGEAALAIMNLAWRWPEVKKEFVEGGALDPIVAMLKGTDTMAKEYAVGALMNMTAGSKENAERVVKAVKDCAELLRSESMQTAEWAAGALANIVHAGDAAQADAFAADAPASLAELLPKVTAPGKPLVVLALTSLAEKNADVVRKALGAKEKAKLKEFKLSGAEDLETSTSNLVEMLGPSFTL